MQPLCYSLFFSLLFTFCFEVTGYDFIVIKSVLVLGLLDPFVGSV